MNMKAKTLFVALFLVVSANLLANIKVVPTPLSYCGANDAAIDIQATGTALYQYSRRDRNDYNSYCLKCML